MRRLGFILFLVSCAVMLGDEVRLANGSLLKGKVVSISDGKLKIETDFAGTLTISMQKVAEVTTDKSMQAKVDDAPKGEAQLQGNRLLLGGKEYDLKDKTKMTVWQTGAKDPTLPEGRKWEFGVSGLLLGKNGNTDKLSTAMELHATLKGPVDTLKLKGTGLREEENTVENERKYTLGVDYERRLKIYGLFWFGSGVYEYDKYRDKDPEVTTALGLGKYWIETKDYLVKTRIGIARVDHWYVTEGTDKETSMAMTVGYMHKLRLRNLPIINDLGTLNTALIYIPQFNNADDFRITHDSYLELPVGTSRKLSLRLGVNNDYYHKVAEGKRHTDTTYYTKLVFEWK